MDEKTGIKIGRYREILHHPSDRKIAEEVRLAMLGVYRDFQLEIIDKNTLRISYNPSTSQIQSVLS